MERLAVTSINCFTAATKSDLAQAINLAQSLKKFHPSWNLSLLYCDRISDGRDELASLTGFDDIIYLEELGERGETGWIFKKSYEELKFVGKATTFKRQISNNYEIVFFIDANFALFGVLDEALDALKEKSIVLVPHIVEAARSDGQIRSKEIASLKYGSFNLGFIGVKNSNDGMRFLNWWEERIKLHCHDEADRGLYFDQKWCDLAPAFFDVEILRNKGYGFSAWNLPNRAVKFDTQGFVYVDDQLLKLVDFRELSEFSDDVQDYVKEGQVAVVELIKWYNRQIDHYNINANTIFQQGFDRYDNGIVIAAEHRLLYRHRRDLQLAFPDPFSTQPGSSYFDWYQAQGAGK